MRNWSKSAVVVILSAAGILMVTMGARQSLGLFVSPLNSSTALGITTISFALAIGQLMWGAIQPWLARSRIATVPGRSWSPGWSCSRSAPP